MVNLHYLEYRIKERALEVDGDLRQGQLARRLLPTAQPRTGQAPAKVRFGLLLMRIGARLAT